MMGQPNPLEDVMKAKAAAAVARQYSDLVLELRPDPERNTWTVEVASVRAGAPPVRCDFDLPFGPEKAAEIEGLLHQLHVAESDVKATRKRLKAVYQEVGQALYAALFAGAMDAEFRARLASARSQSDHGLRLRIRWNPGPAELEPIGALPWELLYRQATHDHLALLRDVVLSRHLHTERVIPPYTDNELRVLLVASEPQGSNPIQADTDMCQIYRALQEEGIRVKQECAVLEKVRDRLLKERFHVLHFIGHGDFWSDTGEGMMLWTDEHGQKQWLKADFVADRLKGIDSLRLVVLSSCWSAALPRAPGQDAQHAVAAALALAGIPAVVGMQFPITIAAAIAFNQRFYQRLAASDPVDVAAAEARLSMQGDGVAGGVEWPLPAVFLQGEDGRLFGPDGVDSSGSRSAPATAPATAPPAEASALRLGIRSFPNGFGAGMENEVERLLPLEGHFPDPRDPQAWEHPQIFSELEAFLRPHYVERRPLILDFAAHWSLAFAAGYCLEAKSGLDIRVFQRGQGGRGFWMDQDAPPPPPDQVLWTFDSELLTESAAVHDVAVAISVTWDIHDEVHHFLTANGESPVRRLLHAKILPEPGQRAVSGGTHALCLALQLSREIRRRTIRERQGTLHLFGSAPNALIFFLAQLARAFGAVQLYEHPWGSDQVGVYFPSLRFPPRQA